MKRKEETRSTFTFGPFWHFSKSHKNFDIEHFDTQIFAIRSTVPTEAIEVLKRRMYASLQCKKK